MISGFHRSINEICALLGFYAAQNRSFLAAFRDNLSVPSSRVKQSVLETKQRRSESAFFFKERKSEVGVLFSFTLYSL
jgi:hypothetical protein